MYWTSTPVPKDCDIWETCMWVCALPTRVNCASWSYPVWWGGIVWLKEVRSQKWNWDWTLKKHTHFWKRSGQFQLSLAAWLCASGYRSTPGGTAFNWPFLTPARECDSADWRWQPGTTSQVVWIQVAQEPPIRSCSGWFRCKMWTSISQEPQPLLLCTPGHISDAFHCITLCVRVPPGRQKPLFISNGGNSLHKISYMGGGWIRSHTKISGIRGNSTLRDKGTRRGKSVVEAAEVETKAVLSCGRRSCPAAAGDGKSDAEMGNQMPFMSPWRDYGGILRTQRISMLREHIFPVDLEPGRASGSVGAPAQRFWCNKSERGPGQRYSEVSVMCGQGENWYGRPNQQRCVYYCVFSNTTVSDPTMRGIDAQ